MEKNILIISFLCMFIGMLFFAFSQKWIIIQMPISREAAAQYETTQSNAKKKITLWFWKDGVWHNEHTDLIWPDDPQERLSYLIANWLKLLIEDNPTQKKILVESVLLSPSQTDAYISFDRYPFDKQYTIHTKLMWIESLFKTIRENNIRIQGVRFLVHHTPLQDPHLDFSKEWPIIGFMTQN